LLPSEEDVLQLWRQCRSVGIAVITDRSSLSVFNKRLAAVGTEAGAIKVEEKLSQLIAIGRFRGADHGADNELLTLVVRQPGRPDDSEGRSKVLPEIVDLLAKATNLLMSLGRCLLVV
jgi:hypothetical protein